MAMSMSAVNKEFLKVSFLTVAAFLLPSDPESDLSELQVPVLVMAMLQAGVFASVLLTERVSGRNCEKKIADDFDSDQDDATAAGHTCGSCCSEAFSHVWECISSVRPGVLSVFCIVTAVTLYVGNLVAQQNEIPAAGEAFALLLGLMIRAAIALAGVKGLEIWLSRRSSKAASEMCACDEQCDSATSYDLCPYSEDYWADAMPEKVRQVRLIRQALEN
eukprot:TRINITY_DN47850_c0_g1_i1.p1 TRINITY_DN47850_c0_g1~~TRINITY_DN47850_c0_g1_i1.p1  ORF type:complete len:219 (-),score=44.00 TRINITY_DN47850_c0_g1_i1:341-997(-)